MRLEGRVHRRDNFLPLRRLRVRHFFGEGRAHHRLRRAIDKPGIEQPLDDERPAARLVEVPGDVLAARLQRRDHRRALADRLVIFQHERDADLIAHRREVQDGVRRAARRGDDGDGIEERLARQDILRRAPRLENVHDERARLLRRFFLLVHDRGDAVVAHRREAERFEGEGHRVRGELAAARAGAGDGMALDVVQLLIVDPARRVRADRLEDIDNRQVLAASNGRARRSRRRARGREARCASRPIAPPEIVLSQATSTIIASN